MLHGAGIFTNIYPINEPNVGIYIMEKLVGGFNPSEKYQSVGKDCPIYYGK
jgi:hypothetical protein